MVHGGNEIFSRVRLYRDVRKIPTVAKDDGNSRPRKLPQQFLVLPPPMAQQQRVDRIPPVPTNIFVWNGDNPQPRFGLDELRTSLYVDDERISRPRSPPLPRHTRRIKDTMFLEHHDIEQEQTAQTVGQGLVEDILNSPAAAGHVRLRTLGTDRNADRAIVVTITGNLDVHSSVRFVAELLELPRVATELINANEARDAKPF
mmetsp:Transcript_31551/g.92511  ORF Transcript_31551/g.92511 Transcript_31551/m.92511 type:complete len:202 (-) Transcript_31551:1094-1699(-)